MDQPDTPTHPIPTPRPVFAAPSRGSGPSPERPRPSKLPWFVAVFFLLLAAAAFGARLHLRSVEFSRATLFLSRRAEEAYRAGEIARASVLAASAAKRLREKPQAFTRGQKARIEAQAAFLRRQANLWKQAGSVAADLERDPGRARADLEALLDRARTEGARGAPLRKKIGELHRKAVTAHEKWIERGVRESLPSILEPLQQGRFDAFGAALREAVARTEALSVEARSRILDADPFPELVQIAELYRKAWTLHRSQGLHEIDVEEGLKRIRDRVPDPEGLGKPLREKIQAWIRDLQRETRAPLPGLPVSGEQFRMFRQAIESASRDFKPVRGSTDPKRKSFELVGRGKRLFVQLIGPPVDPRVLVVVDRVRMAYPISRFSGNQGVVLESALTLSAELRDARPAGLFADRPWEVVAGAPGPCALQPAAGAGGTVLYLGGRLYRAEEVEFDADPSKVVDFVSAAVTLERRIRNDAAIPEEVRVPLADFVQATHAPAPPEDYLEPRFCREAVAGGYLERQVPGIERRLHSELSAFRNTYRELVRFRPRMRGEAPDGCRFEWSVNLVGQHLWRITDRSGPTTTFAVAPWDGQGARVVVRTVFEGKHRTWPENDEPLRIEMAHPSVGVLAVWDLEADELRVDENRWRRAVRAQEPAGVPPWLGPAEWRIPPHALRVDSRGRVRAMRLSRGTLRARDFGGLEDSSERRRAQEKYLEECARTMRSAGELHLFYRYFVQYVLDSPLTTATGLIGNSRHTGDVHQDAFQTLDRRLAGRYLADCDDLAELYQVILRRQGRPAFVLGTPGHATCGVAEKVGDRWRFICVDTGPPRRMTGRDLDRVVERLLRTYDPDGTMEFDPRSVHFLFRFSGEQTRSSYYLDTRMFRDPAYAEIMTRVQEYWHFHFYALAIETMKKMLETDRMPANSIELAALYGAVGDYERGLPWIDAAIRDMDPEDRLSRLGETMRKARYLKELDRKEEGIRVLEAAAGEIRDLVRERPGERLRFRRLAFEIAAWLSELGRPWQGWRLISGDFQAYADRGRVPEGFFMPAVVVYRGMCRAEREGRTLDETRRREMARLGSLLLKGGFFLPEDSFFDRLRKYPLLLGVYAAREGPAKAYARLLEGGFPEGERDHIRRGEPDQEEIDWRWIRLSPLSYQSAVDFHLDRKEKENGAGGVEAALKAIDAMERALPEIRKRGSSGSLQFIVLGLRLLRACFKMDEKELQGIFTEMKRQNWGRLYERLAESLGQAAPHMSVRDFCRVFRMFCEAGVPRPHPYGVIYRAYQDGALDQALAASRVALELYPDDADMKREHLCLERLIRERR